MASLDEPTAQQQPSPEPERRPERLLQTMDELDLYREWSHLVTQCKIARVANKANKMAMLAILNERIQKMGVSDDQTRRFRKLYELVEGCNKLHKNDGKRNEVRSVGKAGKK